MVYQEIKKKPQTQMWTVYPAFKQKLIRSDILHHLLCETQMLYKALSFLLTFYLF